MPSEILGADGPAGAPLFLHIGAHKAGSSTIQGFFQDHEEALAGLGVLYPTVGRSPNGAHHDFANTLRHGAPGPEHPLWVEVRRLRAGAPEGQCVVLSSEGFETLPRHAVERLPSLLGPGRVQVLVYMRDVAGAVVSAYGQRTKTGTNLLDFDRFFDRTMRREAARRQEVVRAWAEIFGPGNLRVRLLDPAALVGGDLVEDVLHAIGCSTAALGVAPAARRNVSPGWKATETLRAVLGHLAPLVGLEDEHGVVERVRRATEAAAAASGIGTERGEYLTAEQRRACDEATLRQVEALNALLPGHDLRAPPPRSGAPPAGRPFMPSIEHVPGAELAVLMAHMSVLLATRPAGAAAGRRRPPDGGAAQVPPDVLELRRARRARRKEQFARQAGQ